MNWIRDNLKWLAVLTISVVAAGAGLTIWQQRAANTELELQLTASNTQRDSLATQAADVKEQLQHLDAITRNATARAVKLETITHEDPDAERWGDTRLPAAVARLLDTTQAGDHPAGPPDRDAGLRDGGGLPDPGQQPDDQPPSGAEPAEHARGA